LAHSEVPVFAREDHERTKGGGHDDRRTTSLGDLGNLFELNPAMGTVLAAIDGVCEITATTSFDPAQVRRIDVWLSD
jgi:hypothetical protein